MKGDTIGRQPNRSGYRSISKLSFSNFELPSLDVTETKNKLLAKTNSRFPKHFIPKESLHHQTESSASFFKGGSLRTSRTEILFQKEKKENDSVPERDLDSYLHRTEVSINVADQIRKLNQQLLENDGGSPQVTQNNLLPQSGQNIPQQTLTSRQFSHTKIDKSGLNNTQLIKSVSSISNRGKRSNGSNQSTRNNLEGEDTIHRKSSEKCNMRSASNFFGMTQASSKQISTPSEYQKNLLKALEMCDQGKLDQIVYKNVKKNDGQRLPSQEVTPIHSFQDHTRHSSLTFRKPRVSPIRQPFRVNDIRFENIMSGNSYQSKEANWQQFLSHFDSAKKDIARQIQTQQKLNTEQETQNKPLFKKIDPIRQETLLNIKQFVKVQKMRENKISSQLDKHDDVIQLLKTNNQIEIIKQNTNKIKNLKVVADLIDSEIGGQNEKIDTIVTNLMQKFHLHLYENNEYPAHNQQQQQGQQQQQQQQQKESYHSVHI